MKFNLRNISLIFVSIFYLSSCIVVKHEGETDVAPAITLSPKPEIDMSDELVRSMRGDMIAFIPEDWFFIDVEEESSSDVFAVAVNPDYTLSAVFSNLKKTGKMDEVADKEGLLGVARMAFAKHQQKTAGGVKQFGKYSTINIGPMSYAQFMMANSTGALITKAVVFKSSLDQYYEFALMPMNITGKPIPSGDDFDRIFRSILSTVQY